MKIEKVIRLSSAFATEVNVLRDYKYRNPQGNEQKMEGYLPNKSSRDIIKSILLSCSESTDKKLHLITASYGTGKSYLLLMIANLMANQNKNEQASLVDKIRDKEDFYKDGLSSTLDNHINNSDPFLIVIPEYGDPDFDHALLEGLKYALKNNDIAYTPKNNYEECVKTISHWESKSPDNYKLLKNLITNSTIEKFIEQLNSYNPSTYLEFKKYFSEIIGTNFPESHTSAYPIFADTAKEIRKKGFKGIAIVYDEFGEMLGKLINSSSSSNGLKVQQFLEDVKDKKENCNIVLISASHQDPNNLKASKEKDLNKIIGRFERHQLIVSESEGEEIIGTIFIKEDLNEFTKIYKNPLFDEHLGTIKDFNLYPNKDSDWIETKILKNLYPLHPLTSYILPRLSAEFAQNTRSMFNFLSPSETKEGAFINYLKSSNVIDNDKLNLFTPDLLLDFFMKNIREDKEGRVQALYEVYRVGIGKVTDSNHQSIMKNLFMLCVVSKASIQPKKETLFWAMNWKESRRQEFYNLLDDLTSGMEYIELNPTDKTYQFPDFGAAPLSKVIDEEIKKLDDLSLAQCLEIWSDIVELEPLQLRDHNNRYGSNRQLYTASINDTGSVISSIKDLEDYYNNDFEYFGNGYLFYLFGKSEDEIEELKLAIKKKQELLPYIIFGTPVNLPQFDNLIKETLHLRAIQNTGKRPDVIQNPARNKSIVDQIRSATSILEEKIKTLYEPSNWKWNYQLEADIELSSKPKFSTWVNNKIDFLFSETLIIKDEALWFIDGNKGAKDRKQALDILLNSDKDRIPLRDDSNSAAEKRIIRNLFSNIGLTADKKREKNIQYGEIKTPDQDSSCLKAWRLIDTKLKSGSKVNPLDIINPLLKSPFGFSEQIIKFLLASYIRYNIERISIVDSKRHSVQNISVDLIENLIKKPVDYFIRKIEISGPELRYLSNLKSIFDKQDTHTWMDVTQKFIGITQFLSPVHKGIIKESRNEGLQKFYDSLDTLKIEFQANGSDKEKMSQDYFQENLPTLLFHEGRTFIDDESKVTKLINVIKEFKKFPYEKETEKKLDIIQAVARDVFGTTIVTKTELTTVVLNWFKELPSSNQNGKYADEIIMKWLLEIKIPTINDPFELYLDKLNEKPFKDWEDISYEKHQFIARFVNYKKIIEEYTKSPLEVLQIIARDVFNKSSSECSNEKAFDGFFKDWWSSLSSIYKAEQYSKETNVLISQILLPSAIKTRYLETIPQVWKKYGYLPEHVPEQWESWDNSNTYIVAEKYIECINEVRNWKPPIEEDQFFISLGNIFNASKTDSSTLIYSIVKKWYEELAEKIRSADWEKINEQAFKLLASISDEEAFEKFILSDAAFIFKLPEFKLWDNSILETYLNKFQILKKTVEDYKRPLFEIVEIIEEKNNDKSITTEAFCFNLYSKIIESDAFKNKIDSELLIDNFSIILYNSAKSKPNNFTLDVIITLFAEQLEFSSNWNLWSKNDEKSFVSSFKKGVDNIVKWKFPEGEKLKKAKIKVKQSIAELQKELSLDSNQMRKVLNDIIDEK